MSNLMEHTSRYFSVKGVEVPTEVIMAPTVPEQVQGEPALEIEPITRGDVGSWPGQEQRLRFKACELCNGINHYCHCYYWSRGDRVGIIGHSNFCTPEWLVESKAKGQWKGRIIIPQGASGRFLKAGEVHAGI
jgi:hypothetical protein